MKKTIEVTRECIAEGVRGSYRYCPVAVALRRAGFRNPWVYRDTMRFNRRKMTLKTPPEAVVFIREFDRGMTVEPFSFTITL
jgi:hypothetical protein